MRFFFAGFIFRDSGGFFDQKAAVFGLGIDDLADLALLDDGVAFGSDAGIHEEFMDVFEAGGDTVDEIFAFARAIEAAGDGNFLGAKMDRDVLDGRASGCVFGVDGVRFP